ncbi:methionine adenosyltransferase, partial [bacterium]|nr:methionine adenosyltransferase [bacterium]
MEREYLFTSESVSEGHPDKIADQISDAILDAFLAQDPFSRVGCETLLAKNLAVVALEFRTAAEVSIPDIVREVIRDIGYTDPSYGFDYRTCEIITSISPQSGEIAGAVNGFDGEIGAGDQGMMFGYATRETPELVPLPILLAHRLVQKQAEVRKSGILSWLRPDAKSQVTVRYVGSKPVAVEKVVLSTQHSPETSRDQIEEEVVAEIIEKAIPEGLRAVNIVYMVNPSGSFTSGGPQADSGLTGRKIIADTYGGSCPHGGGAF